MTRTLVAGSYPPVPGAASAATLAAVRAELAAGAEVEVVSPRPSAAHHTASLHGAAGALALYRWGSRMQADSLVLCVEPGVPFVARTAPWRARLDARALRLALRRFRRVVLLVPAGLPDADGPAAGLARALWARAEVVAVPDDATRAAVARVGGVRPASVVVVGAASRAGEVRVPADGPGGAALVTVDGPVNHPPGRFLARARGASSIWPIWPSSPPPGSSRPLPGWPTPSSASTPARWGARCGWSSSRCGAWS